jgi:hypothetical protein
LSNTTTHKLVKKIISESFSPKKLSSYALCLNIGTRDFQITVVNEQTSSCVLLLDYKLENIKTVKGRVEIIQSILGGSKMLSSDQWNSIKVSFKSHKFSLVPNSHFIPEASSDYLALNCEIKTKIDEVYYYKHISSSAVNIFASDNLIISFLKKTYSNKSLQVIHQGSALIEGVLKYDDHSQDKTMFSYIDRGLLHIVVTEGRKLLYYNQFATHKSEEILKYIMLVFKEMKMSSKSSPVVVWGLIKQDSELITLAKKYIRNISLGTKPNFLKFGSEFDAVDDHRYFDAYSIFLCE